MEYLQSEGKLLTLEACTAISNIPAGTPVGALTGSTDIYTLGRSTVGFSCTALLGYHFLGVLADSVSANESPVTVFTEGVFTFRGLTSDTTSAMMAPGWPVWADSGSFVSVGAGQTGDAAIGTLVNRPTEATGVGGAVVHVKINPMIYRWGCWVGTLAYGAYATGTQAAPFGWPKRKGHA